MGRIFATMSDRDKNNLTNKGMIVAVRGSVVDVRFDAHLPSI
jgi:hypothetical protein